MEKELAFLRETLVTRLNEAAKKAASMIEEVEEAAASEGETTVRGSHAARSLERGARRHRFPVFHQARWSRGAGHAGARVEGIAGKTGQKHRSCSNGWQPTAAASCSCTFSPTPAKMTLFLSAMKVLTGWQSLGQRRAGAAELAHGTSPCACPGPVGPHHPHYDAASGNNN